MRLFGLKVFLPRRAVYISALTCSLMLGCAADAAPLSDRMSAIIKNYPRMEIGVSVLDASTGEALFRHRSRELMKPASVLKVITSVVALKYLGPEYRFLTGFYGEGERPGGLFDTLYVKGGGDPSLAIEQAWLIARQLKGRGVKGVGQIVLDSSLYVEDKSAVGQRAYQTGASALSFNFNSVSFRVCPTAAGRDALVTADPWEADVKISGVINTINGSGGSFSIDRASDSMSFVATGSIGKSRGCEQFYRSVDDPRGYFGAVFKHLLDSAGITVRGKILAGRVPLRVEKLFEHRSKSLADIVTDMNHFSNNFIAEQLLYAVGSGSSDSSWSREAGLKRLAAYLGDLGFPSGQLVLSDGSGLSHQNRISADMISASLGAVFREPYLRPILEYSLSVSGRSGTLKDRDFGGGDVLVRGKTGTLDGVSSLAGYRYLNGKRAVAFSIFINNAPSRSEALRLEELLVRELH